MEDNRKENVQDFSPVSAAAKATAAGAGGNHGGGGGGGAREDDEALKRTISCHPLYGLLIETHLDCLKASLGDIEEFPRRKSPNQANNKINASIPGCSDLDHFMELYCMALSELKEAIEDPVQETTTFINGMYFQLMELTGMGRPHPMHPTPTSPGDERSNMAHLVRDLDGSTGEHGSNSNMPSGILHNDFLVGTYEMLGTIICMLIICPHLVMNKEDEGNDS